MEVYDALCAVFIHLISQINALCRKLWVMVCIFPSVCLARSFFQESLGRIVLRFNQLTESWEKVSISNDDIYSEFYLCFRMHGWLICLVGDH